MTNPYFNWGTPLPRRQTARSEAVNAGFVGVEAGFDALPDPDDIRAGTVNYAVDTGSPNAMQIALTGIAAYVDGLSVALRKSAADNTGALTLQVNNLGTRAIRRPDGSNVGAGDMSAGSQHRLIYDEPNARWTLQTVTSADVNNAAASATAAAASSVSAAISAQASSAQAAAALASAAAASAAVSAQVGPVRAHHIGSTPPEGFAAGWVWHDTSTVPATLRLRNVANTAWVTIISETVAARTVLGNLGASPGPALPGTMAALLAALQADGQVVADVAALLTASGLLVPASVARAARRPDVLAHGFGGGPGTLVLNVMVRNMGTLATLAANRFTLPVGEYEILAFSGIWLNSNIPGLASCSTQLRNVTLNQWLGPVVGSLARSNEANAEGASMFSVLVSGSAQQFELHGASENVGWEWRRQQAAGHAGAPLWSQQVAIWRIQ